MLARSIFEEQRAARSLDPETRAVRQQDLVGVSLGEASARRIEYRFGAEFHPRKGSGAGVGLAERERAPGHPLGAKGAGSGHELWGMGLQIDADDARCLAESRPTEFAKGGEDAFCRRSSEAQRLRVALEALDVVCFEARHAGFDPGGGMTAKSAVRLGCRGESLSLDPRGKLAHAGHS